ncbi:hypothetical protein [Rubripirellula lacrimiformis]|uniref:hypothetical protein n=1 Tax=Rubripirellula lacrimiformis TaxID=1930273 RepID=UPI00119E4799|nr:hypothetical protein [Rubripirellula lacrimiformis]
MTICADYRACSHDKVGVNARWLTLPLQRCFDRGFQNCDLCHRTMMVAFDPFMGSFVQLVLRRFLLMLLLQIIIQIQWTAGLQEIRQLLLMRGETKRRLLQCLFVIVQRFIVQPNAICDLFQRGESIFVFATPVGDVVFPSFEIVLPLTVIGVRCSSGM